ncbi:MAG: hypothetical protein ACAH95_02315 [Fimbriimonas sp.]
MIRKLLLLSLLGAASLAHAEDLHSLLVKHYNELNAAIQKRDQAAAEKWIKANLAPGFLCTSKDKLKYDAKGFLQGLKDQMKLTRKVEFSKLVVGKPSIKGNRLSLNTHNDFKGIVLFDNQELTLTDVSETLDTWIKLGSTWKLKSIVQTKAKTQLFQKH